MDYEFFDSPDEMYGAIYRTIYHMFEENSDFGVRRDKIRAYLENTTFRLRGHSLELKYALKVAYGREDIHRPGVLFVSEDNQYGGFDDRERDYALRGPLKNDHFNQRPTLYICAHRFIFMIIGERVIPRTEYCSGRHSTCDYGS